MVQHLSLSAVVLSTAALVFQPVAHAEPALPPIPEAVSSFGAMILDDSIYIFGGHMGRVPGNSRDGLSPHFARLNLKNAAAGWEDLPMLETSQSPGLVAWNGKIYRVGGLSFRNSAGEPTNYNSLDIFAQFDPETGKWTELPSLPSPRSSLDAAVVDGKLYVVGGWNLQESNVQDAPWHEEALVFDLSDPKGQWKPIAKPPFQTRALAAASCRHKLYVLGGMKSTNQTTKEVHVYDPATDRWSTGPALEMTSNFGGFALAAFGSGDSLYLSGGSGTVYQLNRAGDGWEPLERLFFPRMFHRLVVGPEDQIVVLGGVSGRTYLSNVEAVSAKQPSPLKSVAWDVKFPGLARHSQALLIHGGELYAFGGNKSTGPHDFQPENFSNEAFAFQLASQKVTQLAPLPQPMQSGAAFVSGTRIDSSIYVVGGLAPNTDGFGASDVIQQYRLRSKKWNEELQHLPAPRSMFTLGIYDHSAWIFGGSTNRLLAKDTWVWNPLNDSQVTVVEGADIPTMRRSHAGAVLGGKYYVVGGLGDESKIADKAFAFDFESKKWSEIAAPQHSRVFSYLASSGGKLYLAGGFSRVDGHFAGTTAIEVYDPEKNRWEMALEEQAPMLSKMQMLSYDDRLLFYRIDADQAGLAHFVLVDPHAQTEGYGEQPAPTVDRTAGQEVTAQLKALDKNRDGGISVDEVGGRFQRLVKRVDADGDGTATPEEIQAFAKQLDEESRPGVSGRDGASGRAQGSSVRGNSAEGVARMFSENDADQDGLLKGDEIPERLRMGMDRFDANKDGALSREEFEEAFQSFRGRRDEKREQPSDSSGNRRS